VSSKVNVKGDESRSMAAGVHLRSSYVCPKSTVTDTSRSTTIDNFLYKKRGKSLHSYLGSC
jgi:hypothetical protein